ncbi:adenosylcobinamide-phosphate synthase CbiB [Pararhizobium haloflavum]|uniref:adenosylcobinamide-phosphate synthase CbiB n=1 Tax=Pararhizobium haloflavum TaxID=2037914 RepID=UPI001FDEAD86|nr:adenosylcobinamide-phosphate synthase CbiB [Pararhizobium haloflavum]
MDIQSQLAILAAALVADRLIGDPDWLWRRVAHPVALFGALIAALDRTMNDESDGPGQRRKRGRQALLILLLIAMATGAACRFAVHELGTFGIVLEITIVAILLAQRSLSDHVAAVASGLRTSGIDGGRSAVARIVGRDPATLDEQGVRRAAIESLAENFSDGVVAPAFWYAILGLPGLFAYKMLNTADSMIGHRSPRHVDFGRAAAIADDWANWPAARLSALLITAAAFMRGGVAAARAAMGAALRDHGLHRSPNAGWPEAAMAGALDIRLAGPRSYGGVVVTEPMLNAAGRGARAGDIERALALYASACSLMTVGAMALAAITMCA